MIGRVTVLVGLTCGLLGVSLPFVSGARYLDDGTTATFLLVVLALSSWFPAEVGTARLGAALGGAAFGLFLFFPALYAFEELGSLRSGAWLGLCTLLIPAGVHLSAPGERSPRGPRGVGDAVGLIGVVLLVAGIWLPLESGEASIWNAASSGHALGLVMLLLAAAGAALILLPGLADLRLVAAAVTFGLLAAPVIITAFEQFGTLGAGAWLEACAGVLILGGATAPRAAPSRRGSETGAATAAAGPGSRAT